MRRVLSTREGTIRQNGLTLVELMVSLVLSLVLMLGALQLFGGSKETYRLSDALARVQENGRFALNLLTRDLRQAGHTGCVASPDFANVLNEPTTPPPSPWLYDWHNDFTRPVFGYEGGVSTFPTELTSGSGSGSVASNPDAVVVLFGDSLQGQVVTGPTPPSASAALTVAAGIEFLEGQAMLVTDCSRAALFELSADKAASGTSLTRTAGSGTTNTPGNCTANLHDSCGSGVPANLLTPYAADISRILPLRAHGYYLANTNRRDADGNFISALYRQRLTDQGLVRDELLEGVTNLQVLYGVAALNGRSAENFIPADEVADDEWARVVAVRVELTAQAVNDPDLFRNFSTTVALRNRTL